MAESTTPTPTRYTSIKKPSTRGITPVGGPAKPVGSVKNGDDGGRPEEGEDVFITDEIGKPKKEYFDIYGKGVGIKVIKDFQVPATLTYASGVGRFKIIGDEGAKFFLEIKLSGGEWYNWDTRVFSTTQSILKRTIKGSEYNGEFTFPKGSKTETITYWLHAVQDSCGITKHTIPTEAFKDDGTIDLNNSIGSATNIWKKESYQGPVVDIQVSSIAPTLADGGEVWNGADHSVVSLGSNSDTRRSSKKGNFKITVTSAAGKSIRIDRQPKSKDFCIHTAAVIGAATPGVYTYVLQGEDIWSGTARSTNQTMDGGGSPITGSVMTMDVNCSGIMAVGDRVTGNAALDAKTGDEAVYVTVVGTSGDAKDFTISESITIADNETLTFTPPRYYKWPVTNYIGLTFGSIPKNNTSITSGSYISDYTTFKTVPVIREDNCETYSTAIDRVSFYENSITPTGAATFSSYGRATSQAGELVFNNPQYKVFESTTHNFYTYGESGIAGLLRSNSIKITNLKAEITFASEVETTISDASATGSASLNDFDVASVNGIMSGVSMVYGANIDTKDGVPVVSNISTNNLTLTPGGHYVQNGQTLKISGTASLVTITGHIEIDNIGDNDTTLYLDVEKFLTCA